MRGKIMKNNKKLITFFIYKIIKFCTIWCITYEKKLQNKLQLLNNITLYNNEKYTF